MKKFLALCLTAVLAVAGIGVLSGCAEDDGTLKVGFIALHDSNSTYDKNFLDAFETVCKEKNVTPVIKTNVSEDNSAYDAACELADEGCEIVFADSFGHEEHVLRAAAEFPNVEFCHATGVQALTATVDNFHNAFASIYEGRYLAGVAAGMKLKEQDEAGTLKGQKDSNGNIKIGYVGAYTYAEVISGYTAFYLGVKSVVPNLVMEVQFTGSWFDEAAEKSAAETLINRGASLISQHADSLGAPAACRENNVPNVAYNGSTADSCPETYITASRVNWIPYFEYMIDCVVDGEEIDDNWCGTLATGSVVVEELGKNAAEGTQAKLDEVKADLISGELHVFDCNVFTVDGEKVTSKIVGDNIEAIKDGYFHESDVDLFRSAPYFDIQIDGITLLNEKV